MDTKYLDRAWWYINRKKERREKGANIMEMETLDILGAISLEEHLKEMYLSMAAKTALSMAAKTALSSQERE